MARNYSNLKTWLPTIMRVCGAIIHGLLLTSAFPPYEQIECAWVAFIPLLLIARYTKPKQAVLYGIAGGACFWLITLWWLLRLGVTGVHITLAFTGWVLLSLYCAIYTGIFVGVASILFNLILSLDTKIARITMIRSSLLTVLFPILWVGLEYIRSTLFSGFPWNALGISQYRHLMLIQISDIGGVYMISALLIMFNTAVTLTGLDIWSACTGHRKSRLHIELMIALVGVLISLRYGTVALLTSKREYIRLLPVKVGIIQPNIPQLKKWPPEFENEIYAKLEEYTDAVLNFKPDLVILPETALPSVLPVDARAMDFVRDIASRGTYLLVGALEAVNLTTLPESLRDYNWLYNSSFLLSTNGSITAIYRKIHLVPFGEYLPLDKSIKLIRKLAPLGFSCMAGEESTLFKIPLRISNSNSSNTVHSIIKNVDANFSVLICFEDIMSYLARRAVRKGAVFLVNQTNDAWFDNSPAAVQHLSHSVFRAVENKVPIIRCANTGVSCFIDNTGKIDEVTLRLLQSKSIHIGMHRTGEIWIASTLPTLTPYTKYGDWLFAVPCTMITILIIVFIIIHQRLMKHKTISISDNSVVTDTTAVKSDTIKER